MILIDTSVWADHFRSGAPELVMLLGRGEVLQHPFVTGELALGNPPNRPALVTMLGHLPQAQVCPTDDLHALIESHALGGTGIGLVDAHLLASTLSHDAKLWTRDKRLQAQAERLGLSYGA